MPEQMLRRAAFERRHPEVRISREKLFGVWHADVPLGGNGERHLADHDLGKLLDRLDDVLPP